MSDGERRDVLEGLSGYTPGPWTAATADLHGEDDTRWSVLTAGERQYFIASIENGAPGDTLETEFANALLTARAPALVDEIRELRAAVKAAYWEGWRHGMNAVIDIDPDLGPCTDDGPGDGWANSHARALLPATGGET